MPRTFRHWIGSSRAIVGALCAVAWTAGCAGRATPTNRPVQAAGAMAARADQTTLARIVELVHTKYFSEERVRELHWDERAEAARTALAQTPDARARERILRELVLSLGTSHTDYITRSEPRYWDLASIFEATLDRSPDNCPNKAAWLPPLPLTAAGIGVFWKNIDEHWYVGGLYAGGPAQKAGLVLGDEVVEADGRPFQPIESFAGQAQREIVLRYRRDAGAPLREATVVPEQKAPVQVFQDAVRDSARIIEEQGKRIGYVRIWSWTPRDMHYALKAAISQLNQQKPDAFVLDMRDGWGGADGDYLEIFQPGVPQLMAYDRTGTVVMAMDSRIHVPAAVLINEGTRSGKETIAYGIQKYGYAKLIGEPTAGAMLAGGPFCLPDGALLYLAGLKVTLDGEVREGKPVPPDVAVPFDIRYAAGRDLQLQAAIAALL